MILAVSSSFVSLLPCFLGLNQLRREIVAGLAPAQLEQPLEIFGHRQIGRILLLDFGALSGARSSRRPPVRELVKNSSRSSSGMPSMSQITVTGSRKAKSAIRSIWPRGFDAIDDLIDDLLNARAHILDAPRRKGAHHETAQAAVVGRIELQHPVAHAAIDRFLENLWAGAPAHPADKILAETLVAQDRWRCRHAGWRHRSRAA